jgi:hypothetical protein
MILGYVETKQVGENLDKVLKSEQIARYKSLSRNILLTDYLHFVWINKDGIQRESLCHATDLESRRFKVRDDRAAAVAGLLGGSFRRPPRVSAAPRHSRWRSPPEANCCATIWERNWFVRRVPTGRGGSTGFSRFFATRCFTN